MLPAATAHTSPSASPSRGPRNWPAVALMLACAAGASALLAPPALAGAPSLTPGYGVSSESPTATRDASQVLNRGGSAVDAAIVAALVAGVTSPTSSGIGGGGFAVVYEQAKNNSFALDFRECGPAALDRAPFERRPLEEAEQGHLVGVPGEVRGLYDLHKRLGNRPWRELVKIAADRALQGFAVNQHLAAMLQYAAPKLQKRAGFSSLFYAGGKPALAGTVLTHPSLGKTLLRIAEEGPAAFYSGAVAEDFVQTARAFGSPMTLDDLTQYRSIEREPLQLEYEGSTVITMPAPSAGGLMMLELLSMLPADTLRQLKHASPAYQHLIAEAMRSAIADRMRYLGDPDFTQVDIQALLDPARLEARAATLSLDRTHALPRFGLEEKGTHALITRDRLGNVVSLTTTINHLFGSKIYAEKSGIFLNNELDDFGDAASVAPFGMTETPNPARPLARPVSSMTPTIVVRDGQAILALGGSGGTAIATNASQTLLAALVFGHTPDKAVSADRIYIPTDHRSVLVERGTSSSHISQLEERGEVVGEMPFPTTAIQMLRISEGRVEGAADPRKHGQFSGGR